MESYYESLQDELESLGLPRGEVMFGSNEKEVADSFRLAADPADANMKKINVSKDNVPFTEARRIQVTLSNSKQVYRIRYENKKPGHAFSAGDVLWGVAYLRGVDRPDAGPVSARFKCADKKNPIYNTTLLPGTEWTRYCFPVRFSRSEAENGWWGEFFLAYGLQTLDIGGLAFFDMGKIDVEKLPKTIIDLNYPGRTNSYDDDIPWLNEAKKRIDTYRKADLKIKVVDGDGNPVKDASVHVKMNRHAFLFGCMGDTYTIADPSHPQHEQYKKHFLENFNYITNATFKYPALEGKWGPHHRKENTLKALDWAIEQGLPVHGHAPIWHLFDRMPADPKKDSKEQMRENIRKWLTDLLKDKRVNGRLYSWDAINHPINIPQVHEYVGKDLMLDEMKVYTDVDPGPVRVVNEGRVLIKGGSSRPAFLELVKWFMENKAPIQEAGFMCHFGMSTLNPPEELYKALNLFADADKEYPGYDLKLKVTEFDINCDMKDPKQRKARADYMRDFYVTCFSHPDVSSIIQWTFLGGTMGLYNNDWSLREHGKSFRELVHGRWMTDETLKTSADGTTAVRGFKGEYTVTAASGGNTVSAQAQLDDQTGEIILKIE